MNSRTLCIIPRAGTSFLRLAGRRHLSRSPNNAFSVANLDSAALRPWYRAANRFGNWRAKIQRAR